MPGCAYLIIDKDKDGSGELCLGGRNIMRGYLKNEAACEKTFLKNGFIKTGDLGYVTDKGYLKINGRAKELIITAGGENVAPVPIEDIFKALCPAVSNIMVMGEGRRFISAIITFKVDVDLKAGGAPTKNLTDEAVKYFQDNCGVTLKTSDEACNNQVVYNHIQKVTSETNNKVISRAAQIKKFTLIPDDFSVVGSELTPTTKLRRNVTEAKYKKIVEAMYAVQAKM